jgi:hypothetical protein
MKNLDTCVVAETCALRCNKLGYRLAYVGGVWINIKCVRYISERSLREYHKEYNARRGK